MDERQPMSKTKTRTAIPPASGKTTHEPQRRLGGDEARAFFEEAKARLLRTAPVLRDVPDPPDVGDGGSPRELLARLRSLDVQIEANLRLVRDFKETEKAATNAAKSPAKSPEEAWRTFFDARSFLATNEGPIGEAQATINKLTNKRRRVLEQMAQTGFFEGRWVNDDGRALYLQETTTEPPAYELHEAPWGWVKDAPPGENPRETLKRGPILERRHRRKNQTLALFVMPFAAYSLAAAAPLPKEVTHVAAIAIFAALLLALSLARENLFGRLRPNPYAERRLIEEEAASAQLYLITRGEHAPPSMDELTEYMLEALRKRRARKEWDSSIAVVENPKKERPQGAGQPDAPSSHAGAAGAPRTDHAQDAPSRNDERSFQKEEQG